MLVKKESILWLKAEKCKITVLGQSQHILSCSETLNERFSCLGHINTNRKQCLHEATKHFYAEAMAETLGKQHMVVLTKSKYPE